MNGIPYHRRRAAREGGFTIAELLVYIVIATVITGSIYQMLIGQNRGYMKQRELMDVRTSLRGGMVLLARELRQGAAIFDLYSIDSLSFAIRSIQGAGAVCAEHDSLPRVGLWGTSGEFAASSDDSALIYSPAGNSWLAGSIGNVWTSPSSAGVPLCDWVGGSPPAPDLVVQVFFGSGTLPNTASGEVSISAQGTVAQGATVTLGASHPALACGDFDARAALTIVADTLLYSGGMSGCSFTVNIPSTAGALEIEIHLLAVDYPQLSDDAEASVTWSCDASGCGAGGGGGPSVLDVSQVGSPFRAFRRVEYGIYQEGGRWWLGRKVGSAASYEKLTGPLRQPSDSGLVFVYYDADGNTTTTPTMVRMVKIIVRGESFGNVHKAAGEMSAQQDTLTTWVSLRG